MSAGAFAPSADPHRPTVTRPSYDPARVSSPSGRLPPSSLTAARRSMSAARTASTRLAIWSLASPARSSPTSSSTLS
eukprot:3024155-Pleurochrysis_carterae.AAC.1